MRWPSEAQVIAAAKGWARAAVAGGKASRVGLLGSYARGRAGPGSDLDLLVVTAGDPGPATRRALAFDATDLPVAADVIVVSKEEWQAHEAAGSGWSKEVRWLT